MSKRNGSKNQNSSKDEQQKISASSSQNEKEEKKGRERSEKGGISHDPKYHKKNYSSNQETDRKKKIAKTAMQDIEWWTSSEQIGEDIASIPFNVLPGLTIDSGGTLPKFLVKPEVAMNLSIIPTIGVSKHATSAVNMAARDLYKFVRHANSGHSNYEAVDLIEYMIAMDSVYINFFHLTKIMKLVNSYMITSRSFPNAILKAMGFSMTTIQEIIRNIAVFRGRINILAEKINSLYVPNVFSLFKRRALIFENVFLDSAENPTWSQYYSFSPKFTWTFDPTTSGGGSLKAIDRFNISSSFSDMIESVESQVDTLLSNEDINIMGGDMLKAYGDSGMYQLQELLPGSIIEPVYVKEIIDQIRNSNSVTASSEEVLAWTITQSSGNLITNFDYDVEAKSGSNYANVVDKDFNLLLADLTSSTDWKFTLEATRLRSVFTSQQVTDASTEIVFDYSIAYAEPADSSNTGFGSFSFSSLCNVDANFEQIARIIKAYATFEAMPTIIYMRSNSGSQPSYSDILFYNDRVTYYSNKSLGYMHDSAVLGVLGFSKATSINR